jgi:sec-independent protein translocase protein TatC
MSKIWNAKNFAPHLQELKKRFLKIILSFLVLFCICFQKSSEIFLWLAGPLQSALTNQGLAPEIIYTHLTEAFNTYMSVAFFASFFLVFPYIEWHVWRFVSPGLFREEKKHMIPFLLLFPCLFLLGGLFCYYYVIPHVWAFFIQFSTTSQETFSIRLLAQMDDYLDIVMKFIFAFGLCFQLPLIMVLLAHIGIGNAALFRRQRRFVIVGIFLVAAFLTPPDVLSQIMLALPLWGLYEASIIVIGIKEQRNTHA